MRLAPAIPAPRPLAASRLATSLLAATLLVAGARPALAHAHLVTAEPAVDATVATPPAAATILFTEGVEPAFSSIAVTDAGGRRVDRGPAHTLPGDAKHLTVGLEPLQPGTYTVRWNATAVDTHKTDGTYHFTVGR